MIKYIIYHHRHKELDDKESTCIYCRLEIHLPLDNNDIPICLSATTFIVIAHRHEAETSVYPSLDKHLEITLQ